MKRRLLASFVALMMLFSLFPSAAIAVEGECEEHSFEVSVLKEATCTATGIQKNKCTVCGYTTYESISASHKWDEGEVVTDATCGEDGKSARFVV